MLIYVILTLPGSDPAILPPSLVRSSGRSAMPKKSAKVSKNEKSDAATSDEEILRQRRRSLLGGCGVHRNIILKCLIHRWNVGLLTGDRVAWFTKLFESDSSWFHIPLICTILIHLVPWNSHSAAIGAPKRRRELRMEAVQMADLVLLVASWVLWMLACSLVKTLTSYSLTVISSGRQQIEWYIADVFRYTKELEEKKYEPAPKT